MSETSEHYDLRDGYVYDVTVKGADTTFWKEVTGTLTVVSNKLRFNADRAVSYIQHIFGMFVFFVNVPTNPAASDARVIGLRNPGDATRGGAYFDFDSDGVFSTITYDEFTNRERTTVTWDSDWSGAEVRYAIRWEPDLVRFYINDVVKATHTSRIGKIAQALDVQNVNADNLDVGIIEVRGAKTII